MLQSTCQFCFQVVVRFSNNIVTANMDNGKEEQLSLDDVDLSHFVTSSEIVVGASHGHDGIGSRDQYQFGSSLNDQETTGGGGLEIHTSGSYAEHFRGCIGEVRVGGILVPFYNDAELVRLSCTQSYKRHLWRN